MADYGEQTGGPEKSVQTLFTVVLAMGPGDFGGQYHHTATARRTLGECAEACRNYIEGENPLGDHIGASAWYGNEKNPAGMVYVGAVAVALVSYNGRVWWLDGSRDESKNEVADLDITPDDL